MSFALEDRFMPSSEEGMILQLGENAFFFLKLTLGAVNSLDAFSWSSFYMHLDNEHYVLVHP
ncbi:hypothetical protein ACHAWO_004417 [Cyclotella atomus]|uniref:Uncharacterized protein n=1 Tax=Cyclotella atomus TaxID=382360 RepID=A0ABD3N2I0_9STRA